MSQVFQRCIAMTLITLLVTSCNFWNSEVSSKKTKKENKTKLQKLRESFAKNELGQMQSQIHMSIKSYKEFNHVLNELKSEKGEAIEEIHQLDKDFISSWGEQGNEVQKSLKDLEEHFRLHKKDFIRLKIELVNNKKSLDQIAKTFTTCQKELTTNRSKVEQQINHANSVLQDYQSKIDGHKKVIARNKKRINRSNWPADKKKYHRKAKTHARKAKKLAKRAVKEKKKFQSQIRKSATALESKASKCSHIGRSAHKRKDIVLAQNKKLLELRSILEQTKKEIDSIQLENKNFFIAYESYQNKRNDLTKGAQQRIDELALKYEKEQESLVLNYGEKYLATYQKIKKWLEQSYLDGEETLVLIKNLKNFSSQTLQMERIIEKMFMILQEASRKTITKSTAVLATNNYRKVASILSDLLGIDIDLSKITIIKITMPNLKLRLPEVRLPKLNLSKINIRIPKINLAKMRFGKIKHPHIRITIPEIKLMNTNIRIDHTFNNIVESFLVEIKIPKLKVVNIKVDLQNDLKNPVEILNNVNREFTHVKANVDREFTKAYQDLRRETDIALRNISREGGKGVNKIGAAFEAAAEPENLVRIFVVYAATFYAGPMGAAFANSILDKAQNPHMSEQEMFNSFIIGAAAGYAAQGVSSVPIKSIQSMPNAASAITRNLTTDVGNVLLNGKSYSTKDFMQSILSGAANINTGEAFANEILDSALNSGANYTVRTIVNGKQFDLESFEQEMYLGLAHGLTRESVHALMDKHIIPYLPKNQDKKILKIVADFIYDSHQTQFEVQVEKFKNLSMAEQTTIVDELNHIQQDFIDYLAKTLNKEEITLVDLSGERIEQLYKEYASVKILENDGPLSILDPSKDEVGVTRNPSSGILARSLMIAFAIYQGDKLKDDIKSLKKQYDKYKKETGKTLVDFMKENPVKVGGLTAEIAVATASSLKFVKSSLKVSTEVAVKIIATAKSYLGKRGPKALQLVDKFKWRNTQKIQDFFIDISTPKQRSHILNGDKTGGGHLWPGKAGKTPFPKSWNGDKIMHEVSDIVTDPKVVWKQITGKAGATHTRSGLPVKYEAIGVRDGVRVKIIVQPEGKGVITAFPME